MSFQGISTKENKPAFEIMSRDLYHALYIICVTFRKSPDYQLLASQNTGDTLSEVFEYIPKVVGTIAHNDTVVVRRPTTDESPITWDFNDIWKYLQNDNSAPRVRR